MTHISSTVFPYDKLSIFYFFNCLLIIVKPICYKKHIAINWNTPYSIFSLFVKYFYLSVRKKIVWKIAINNIFWLLHKKFEVIPFFKKRNSIQNADRLTSELKMEVTSHTYLKSCLQMRVSPTETQLAILTCQLSQHSLTKFPKNTFWPHIRRKNCGFSQNTLVRDF